MFSLLKSISDSFYRELLAMNLKTLSPGKYDFNDGIYMIVEEYAPQKRNQLRFESHKNFVDIQYIIFGSEIITIADLSECKVSVEYNANADITFYENHLLGEDHVLYQGQYVALTPQDAHMPCVKMYGCDYVKKAVMKIPIGFYERRKPKLKHQIKFLVMDVDGTLTDGMIHMGNDVELYKSFNIKDGYALKNILIQYDITPIIITARESQIVAKRANELGIDMLYQGVSNKITTIKQIAAEQSIPFNQFAYIGDDLSDLDCIKICAISGCPADAISEVKLSVDYICTKNGGRGAVREFIEWFISLEKRI